MRQSLGREDSLEEGTATHSSVLAWRIRDRGAWWAAVGGVASVGHDWSGLARTRQWLGPCASERGRRPSTVSGFCASGSVLAPSRLTRKAGAAPRHGRLLWEAGRGCAPVGRGPWPMAGSWGTVLCGGWRDSWLGAGPEPCPRGERSGGGRWASSSPGPQVESAGALCGRCRAPVCWGEVPGICLHCFSSSFALFLWGESEILVGSSSFLLEDCAVSS